jgi:hypothetical protein
LRTQDDHCVLLVSGIILAQYAVTDHMAEAHAMVSLVDQGWANQVEVARAFKCTVRTVRRHQRRFEESGLAGLAVLLDLGITIISSRLNKRAAGASETHGDPLRFN